jgi:hypothetical protein
VGGGFDKPFVRAVAAASVGLVVAATPVTAETPDRSWMGVKRLAVLADLRMADPADEQLKDDFCAIVKRVAERGAPMPVECVAAGTVPTPGGDTVVLVAQAAVQSPAPSQRLLVFTVRKDRHAGLDPAPAYLGAAPRAVPLTNTAADRSVLEEALAASLSEVLPWLRPQATEIQSTISKRES